MNEQMKIAIIGANGRLGDKLCEEALQRGFDVTAIIREDSLRNQNVKNVIHKDLFALTKDDVAGFDALLSAFGSGFNVDPSINRKAINHLAKITKGSGIHLIMVGGAGTLFTDATHAQHVYESEGHPDFLKGISMNICLGLEDLRKGEGVEYTLVCPSLDFDYEGQGKGKYKVGVEQEVLFALDGKSHITYTDFAKAMLDVAEKREYLKKCITICEE